jgi:hypothetical protein
MTDELRDARDRLTRSARELSREVSLNRRVLREALACGDTFARALAGAEQSPVYAAEATPTKTRAQAHRLLDRRI